MAHTHQHHPLHPPHNLQGCIQRFCAFLADFSGPADVLTAHFKALVADIQTRFPSSPLWPRFQTVIENAGWVWGENFLETPLPSMLTAHLYPLINMSGSPQLRGGGDNDIIRQCLADHCIALSGVTSQEELQGAVAAFAAEMQARFSTDSLFPYIKDAAKHSHWDWDTQSGVVDGPLLVDLLTKVQRTYVAKRNFPEVYEMKEMIGSGATATVHRVVERRPPHTEWCVKKMKRSVCSSKSFMTETEVLTLLRSISHPNLACLADIFEDDQSVYIVMELARGGELFDRIKSCKKFSEDDACTLVRKMLLAVGYLHSMGIAHRDLKPENILLADNDTLSEIKITDFGLSKFFSRGTLTTLVGSPTYIAPEVLSGGAPYTKACDLWSLGVILYILLCGFAPFNQKALYEKYEAIRHGNFSFPEPYWSNVSAEAKDLILHLICVDARSRYTVEQALAHPWFSKHQHVPRPSLNSVIENLRNFKSQQKESVREDSLLEPPVEEEISDSCLDDLLPEFSADIDMMDLDP